MRGLVMLCAAAVLAAPVMAQGARATSQRIADAFEGMSSEGRRIMTEAMLEGRGDRERAASRAAHEATLKLLEGETLDPAALAAAMKAEDDLAARHQAERRERLLAAYARLSAADRRAYAAASRASREAAERQVARPGPRR